MSDLVVLGFDDLFKADEVLLALRKLQKQHLLDLEDAAVVIRLADGSVQVKQSYPLVAAGAATGALQGTLWGSLIGLLFLNPLIGAVIGAGVGAGGAPPQAPCSISALMMILSKRLGRRSHRGRQPSLSLSAG